MSMLPNYILVFIFAVFLIYSYINIKVKKAKVSNGCLYGIGIVVAVLLLGMSIYGIIFNIPLGQVQMLIENSFNIYKVKIKKSRNRYIQKITHETIELKPLRQNPQKYRRKESAGKRHENCLPKNRKNSTPQSTVRRNIHTEKYRKKY